MGSGRPPPPGPPYRPLAQLYLGNARALGTDGATLDALELSLRALMDTGGSHWPHILVAPEALAHYMGTHLGLQEDPELVVRVLQAADLHLACGVVEGQPSALRAFEEHYMSFVPQFIASMSLTHALVDEVKQRVRVRLLVGEATARPRIAKYNGRGPLGAWLRVVSLHVARDLMRETKREVPLDADVHAEVVGADPELTFLKARYAKEFRAAFETTLSHLAPRDRNVLRMHFLRSLRTDAIGRMYGVDGSTVRRWITSVRRRVLDETRRRLREELELQPSEVESLMELLRSKFDVSIARLLSRERT